MKERKVYECDHCKKHLMNPSVMKKHEEECWWNPANKTCMSCKNDAHDGYLNNPRKCNAGCTTKSITPNINCEKWEERNYEPY